MLIDEDLEPLHQQFLLFVWRKRGWPSTPYKLTQGVHHRRCRLNLSGWMSLQVTMVRDREHPPSKQFLLTLKRYWLTNSFFGDAGSIRPGEWYRVLGEIHINWQHHVALCIGLDCKEYFVKRWDLTFHRLNPLRTDASTSLVILVLRHLHTNWPALAVGQNFKGREHNLKLSLSIVPRRDSLSTASSSSFSLSYRKSSSWTGRQESH